MGGVKLRMFVDAIKQNWQQAKSLVQGHRAYKQMTEKGQIPDVGALVSLLIVIGVGALVLFNVTGALENSVDDENALAVISEIESMSGTIFNLLLVLGLVIVAVVIISVVRGRMGGNGPTV